MPRKASLSETAPQGFVQPALQPASYLPMQVTERAIALYKSGWRPAFGWVGVLIFVAVGVRISLGLPMPNVTELLAAMSPIFLAMLARTAEKMTGNAG